MHEHDGELGTIIDGQKTHGAHWHTQLEFYFGWQQNMFWNVSVQNFNI